MRCARAWFALTIGVAGCRGDREPPLVAGEGIEIVEEVDRRIVRVDQNRVPVLSDCTEGQVVQRGPGGTWACASAPGDRLRALEMQRGELLDKIAALTEDVEQLERRVALVEAPVFSYDAMACPPREDAVQERRIVTTAGRVGHLGSSLGDVVVHCPVFPMRAQPGWNSLKVSHLDPDGVGTNARVVARLYWLSQTGQTGEVASIESSVMSEEYIVMAIPLMGHQFDFATRSYVVEVMLTRTTTTLNPGFGGITLEAR